MTRRIRVATCLRLPEVDVDEAPLAEAFARAGIEAPLVAWDDPAADWDAPIPTVLRSTWNYAHAVDDFLAWAERAARAAPLVNPVEVVRDNVHKRYLKALEGRGVPIVPTTIVERGEQVRIDGRTVIKPEVGAGSLGAKTFVAGEEAAAQAHVERLTASGGAALVQPYLASVETYGERSIIFIDGELSHAIRKAPRFSGDSESVTGPHPIADDERKIAENALEDYRDRILYGRVDLARDDRDRPVVMELELVEPSLFLARGAAVHAADRFVAALVRRLAL